MITNSKTTGWWVVLRKTNKKGFTLIELLAVIIILSLIALIATSIILNVIENAKKGAFKDSVLSAYNSLELYMFKNGIEKLDESGIEVKKLDLKSDFNGGKFVKKDGKTKAYFIKNNEYCANGDIEKIKVESLKDCYKTDDTKPEIDETKCKTTSTSKEITVIIMDGFALDNESGIKKYEITINGVTKTLEDNGELTFEKLKNGTEYEVLIKAINKAEISSEIKKKETTKDINIPEYTILPEGWSKTKTLTIDYKDEQNLYKHEYSIDGGENFEEYKGEIEIKENCTVIARSTDLENYVEGSSQTITKIDKTAPELELGNVSTTTKSIIIPITKNEDKESGIKSTICSYGTSTGYGTNVEIEENNCNINGLKDNTTYYYKIETTNNAETPTTKTGNITTGQFGGITITQNSTDWTTSKTVTISGSTSGSQLQYQVGSTTGSWTNINSGGTITITENTTVYARLWDGKNESEHATLTVTTIDTTSPGATTVTYNGGSNTCTWKNNYNITLSSSDNVGIAYYEIDHHGNGTVDETTGANFIPPNGWSTCTAIFRAVDHAGNRGPWTNVQHIHMDTQAPVCSYVSLSGGASGEWSNSVTSTAYATDNIGIAGYEYSHDLVNIYGYPNPWTINWNGQWAFYVRSVDHAGNRSAWCSPYILRIARSANVSYTGYFANGQTLSGSDGAMVGVGNSTKMYTININASSPSGVDGNVQYNVHRETHGWTGWLNAGTTACNGENKRIEGIQIRLTGNMANVFDIYYMVHVQSIGDLGWAKNGEIAGSQSLCKRLEKIAIRIVPKDENPANYGINYGAASPVVTDSSKTNCSTSSTCTNTCTRSVPYTATCYKYSYSCVSGTCSGTSVSPSSCGSSGCNCCKKSTAYSCTKYRTETYTCC